MFAVGIPKPYLPNPFPFVTVPIIVNEFINIVEPQNLISSFWGGIYKFIL